MNFKSERLKKYEIELTDLEKWLHLGLVPKKDINKHKEEIRIIKDKIIEEKEKLRFIKENGEVEEYIAPKKTGTKQAYPEPQTLPDMDAGMESDLGMEQETQTFDAEKTEQEDVQSDATFVEEEEENPFSDRNRWKRGILEDPDVDNW